MDLGLKDKVAVVLAASKGMGKASAMALAEEGCNVAMCARGEEALESARKEIEARTGKTVLAIPADVEKKEDRERFLDAVLKEFGTIHILVTNCGGPPPGLGMDLPEEEWEKAVQSTLLVPIHWTRAVAPLMIKQKWGRILNIMSISIKQPIPGLILSNTMRPGVAGFAKSMARELAPHGILVNTLCPGSTRTDRLRALAEKRAADSSTTVDAQWRKMEEEIPLGRIGTPEEFAAMVAFLASERASYVTGTTIQVDGGLYSGLL